MERGGGYRRTGILSTLYTLSDHQILTESQIEEEIAGRERERERDAEREREKEKIMAFFGRDRVHEIETLTKTC